jgi:signal transduction histidine kinase
MINLFKSHYKANDPESKKINPGGHGLGLYISKLIAVNLGGNLTVEST